MCVTSLKSDLRKAHEILKSVWKVFADTIDEPTDNE